MPSWAGIKEENNLKSLNPIAIKEMPTRAHTAAPIRLGGTLGTADFVREVKKSIYSDLWPLYSPLTANISARIPSAETSNEKKPTPPEGIGIFILREVSRML